jgi:hypothetical protein
MADKDEFKFDDDDAFPETDLSGAFSEGEQSVVTGGEPEYPMTIKKAGGSKLKLVLGALLVVLVAGGGAYYYFVMSKPAPMPSPPPRRPVTAVPKPVTAPPPAVPAAPAAGQAHVAVPPSPAKPGAPAAVPVPATAPAPTKVAVTPPPKPAGAVPVPAPAAATPAVAVTPPPRPETKPVPVAAATPAPVVKEAKAKAVTTASGGPWMVEAGTYLNPSDLKTAQNIIRRLGYEPKVSTMSKVVHMTRLRLGSYPEAEAPAALARAKEVAPDAFTLRTGSDVTLYAGTYAEQLNVRDMMGQLINKGIHAEEEPIDMKRTISLLRFGGFASQSSADKAAVRARQEGLAAEVVKPPR